MDQDFNKVKLGLLLLRDRSTSDVSLYKLTYDLLEKLIKILEKNFSDLSIQVIVKLISVRSNLVFS
jgi:hypothetical protein